MSVCLGLDTTLRLHNKSLLNPIFTKTYIVALLMSTVTYIFESMFWKTYVVVLIGGGPHKGASDKYHNIHSCGELRKNFEYFSTE